MMRDLRSYFSRETERKEELREKKKSEMEIIESEDEPERLDEKEDFFVARPNPLEPSVKKKKEKKRMGSNVYEIVAAARNASKDRKSGAHSRAVSMGEAKNQDMLL